MQISEAEFRAARKINIVACGTSWHAGQAGKFMIESFARVPVEVDYASEWRYRDPIVGENTITLVISLAKPPELSTRTPVPRSAWRLPRHSPAN